MFLKHIVQELRINIYVERISLLFRFNLIIPKGRNDNSLRASSVGRFGSRAKKDGELALMSQGFESSLQCPLWLTVDWAFRFQPICMERKWVSNENKHKKSALQINFPLADKALKVRPLRKKRDLENRQVLNLLFRLLRVPGQEKNTEKRANHC